MERKITGFADLGHYDWEDEEKREDNFCIKCGKTISQDESDEHGGLCFTCAKKRGRA